MTETFLQGNEIHLPVIFYYFERKCILYIKWDLFICELQILKAHVTDTGRYVCVAQNLAGAAEKYFNLHVHGEFIFTQNLFHLVSQFSYDLPGGNRRV